MLIESKTKLTRGASVEAQPYLSTSLLFQIIVNVRLPLCAILIVVMMIISLTQSIAEVEAISGLDQSANEYINSPFLVDLNVNLTANNYNSSIRSAEIDDDIREYVNNSTHKSNVTTSLHVKSGASEHLDGFPDVIIPDAVWSFDASTGVHFEHNSSELGLEFDIMPEEVQKNTDFWTRPSFIMWSQDNKDIILEIQMPSPIIIQVASCGSGLAEHSDLEYCHISDNVMNESSNNYYELHSSSDDTALAQDTNSPSTSTATQETQEPSTTLGSDNNITTQNNVIDLSALSDQCVDISSPCTTTVPIDSSPTPTDSPQAPTDSPPASTDPPTPLTLPLISVGDPGPIPEPPITSTPPLVGSPVPETSTWIMMIIGFGIMIGACRRRALNPIKRGTLGPLHLSTKGQWRC